MNIPMRMFSSNPPEGGTSSGALTSSISIVLGGSKYLKVLVSGANIINTENTSRGCRQISFIAMGDGGAMVLCILFFLSDMQKAPLEFPGVLFLWR